MREAPAKRDTRPESSPIVSVPTPAPRMEAEPPPVECHYCRLPIAQCHAMKDAHVDAWRRAHFNDPLEQERRAQIATREMMHQVGKPCRTGTRDDERPGELRWTTFVTY